MKHLKYMYCFEKFFTLWFKGIASFHTITVSDAFLRQEGHQTLCDQEGRRSQFSRLLWCPLEGGALPHPLLWIGDSADVHPCSCCHEILRGTTCRWDSMIRRKTGWLNELKGESDEEHSKDNEVRNISRWDKKDGWEGGERAYLSADVH